MQYCSLQHRTLLHHQIQPLGVISTLAQPLHSFCGHFSTLLQLYIVHLPIRGFIFQCHIFLPFHTAHLVLKARKLKGLPFISPVDHILLELTMARPFWVALHDMAYRFTEVDKAVIPVISLNISPSLTKLMSIELIMPSNRLILCCSLLLLSSIFPSISVFSNKLSLGIRWPKWSFRISPSNEVSPLVSM